MTAASWVLKSAYCTVLGSCGWLLAVAFETTHRLAGTWRAQYTAGDTGRHSRVQSVSAKHGWCVLLERSGSMIQLCMALPTATSCCSPMSCVSTTPVLKGEQVTHHKLAADGVVSCACWVAGHQTGPAIAPELLAAILAGCIPQAWNSSSSSSAHCQSDRPRNVWHNCQALTQMQH